MLDDPRCVTTTRIMRHYMRITIIITTATTSRTVKTTPTLATVMNFIIAFSLPLPRSPVSVSSISARAQYTRTSSPAQHKRNARHCAVAVALTASVQLTRSFPFSVISEDGNGVTENQGGRRQRGTSVNARNAAVRPSYCVHDSNYSIVIAFATLTHLISRDHALLFGRSSAAAVREYSSNTLFLVPIVEQTEERSLLLSLSTATATETAIEIDRVIVAVLSLSIRVLPFRPIRIRDFYRSQLRWEGGRGRGYQERDDIVYRRFRARFPSWRIFWWCLRLNISCIVCAIARDTTRVYNTPLIVSNIIHSS